jgi:hypothetical protein
MSNITLINKNGLNVTVTQERLVEIILHLKKKDIANIALEILDDDDTLKEFVTRRYKDCLKNIKDFNEMSNNPTFSFASDSYKEVSDNYVQEAELWKHLVDYFNKNNK